MRLALAALALLIVAGPSKAALKECTGTILRDTCGPGNVCDGTPTWRKGEQRHFMAWDDEDGKAVLVEYRIGSIAAADVRLKEKCALPKYE